jgi:hypothetical protein
LFYYGNIHQGECIPAFVEENMTTCRCHAACKNFVTLESRPT